MAKPKQNKSLAKGAKRKSAVPRRVKAQFDEAAASYAKLLLNPCDAPLVHPVGAPTGGILIRCQSAFSIVGVGAACGVVHWTPGAIGSNNAELLFSNVADGNTATAFATNASTPGKNFLATNASDCRCVAACMRVYYDGAESTRAGRIAYGQTVGGFIIAGTTVATPQQIVPGLEYMERTPQTAVEVKWRPNEYDLMLSDPQTATASIEKDRRSSLTLVALNQPVGSYLPVIFTAVYEYTPQVNTGITTSLRPSTASRFSFQQVVEAIDSMMSKPWVSSAGASLLYNLPTVFNSMRLRN
jgi:hypothetical protein